VIRSRATTVRSRCAARTRRASSPCSPGRRASCISPCAAFRGSRAWWSSRAEAMSDVIVVGAGPAGAASAILLAERGFDVLVLDRAAFPRPKLCGEYLSPEAARVLDRLGVLKLLDAAGAVPLAGMRITAPDGTVVMGRYRAIGRWRPYR